MMSITNLHFLLPCEGVCGGGGDYVFTHIHRSLTVVETVNSSRVVSWDWHTDWLNNRKNKAEKKRSRSLTYRKMKHHGRNSRREWQRHWRAPAVYGQNDGAGSVGAERKEHVSSRPPQSPDISGPLSITVWGSTLAYHNPTQTGAFEYRHRNSLLI